MFYSVFVHAEYESVVGKILKKFSTKLESKSISVPDSNNEYLTKNFEIRNF